MSSLFHAGRQWRGVADGHRSAASAYPVRKSICNNILLALACSQLCGCITYNTIDTAKGGPRPNAEGAKVPVEEPKPGFYWLLPLTVPADIATSPFQLFFIWIPYWAGYRG